MRRLSILAALCLLSACATGTGGDGSDTGRKYVVFFTTGSATIDASGSDVVTVAAAVARRNPSMTVVVAGYAAAHGDVDADQALSASRADVVAAALRSDGVEAARVRENPRPPANETPAVAARRVEIGFLPPG